MAARKTAGKARSNAGEATADVVEQKVVALAEQLGWFLGTVRGKADGWLESDAVRTEVTRIRDGAAELMEQVHRATVSAQKAAAAGATSARSAAGSVAGSVASSARNAMATASASAKQAVAGARTSATKAVLVAGTAARKAAKTAKGPQPVVVTVAKPSRGAVDAPGKRHRKPPPQESINKRMGEPVGKQMGQKSFQVGKSRGRG